MAYGLRISPPPLPRRAQRDPSHASPRAVDMGNPRRVAPNHRMRWRRNILGTNPTVCHGSANTHTSARIRNTYQRSFIGTVTIGDTHYFGDAIVTADGAVRLFVGGPAQTPAPSNLQAGNGRAVRRDGYCPRDGKSGEPEPFWLGMHVTGAESLLRAKLRSGDSGQRVPAMFQARYSPTRERAHRGSSICPIGPTTMRSPQEQRLRATTKKKLLSSYQTTTR